MPYRRAEASGTCLASTKDSAFQFHALRAEVEEWSNDLDR
jgi:hypothetical protein